MSFGITIILSIAVSLLVISEKLPEGLDIKPVIGVVFIIVFFILCFALVLAAVAVLLGNRKKKLPKIFLSLYSNCCKLTTCRENQANCHNEGNHNGNLQKIARYLHKHFFAYFIILVFVLLFTVLVNFPMSNFGRVYHKKQKYMYMLIKTLYLR